MVQDVKIVPKIYPSYNNDTLWWLIIETRKHTAPPWATIVRCMIAQTAQEAGPSASKVGRSVLWWSWGAYIDNDHDDGDGDDDHELNIDYDHHDDKNEDVQGRVQPI